ncbi:hypothetical protein [Polaribacter sp.]|uniref:hypothetical protein n=1 Tax=Polaribacter sp. TaxID=1920175 RepID=UPI003EF91FF9
MFTKFILKNGFGSPGNTAKILIEHFNRRNQLVMADKPNEIYTHILLDRMLIAQTIGQSYYDRLYDFDKIEEFLENDISTFTFLVLFSESEKFRDGVRPNSYGDSHFDVVTEVIYEVCKKRSSLCELSLNDFKIKANKICRLFVYNF